MGVFSKLTAWVLVAVFANPLCCCLTAGPEAETTQACCGQTPASEDGERPAESGCGEHPCPHKEMEKRQALDGVHLLMLDGDFACRVAEWPQTPRFSGVDSVSPAGTRAPPEAAGPPLYKRHCRFLI